jgi:hypothetical protein
VVIPEIGMTFQFEKDAYEMYNTYAGNIGFSIREINIKRCADKSISSNSLFAANKDMVALGRIVVLVFSLVSPEKEFGRSITLKLTIIII